MRRCFNGRAKPVSRVEGQGPVASVFLLLCQCHMRFGTPVGATRHQHSQSTNNVYNSLAALVSTHLAITEQVTEQVR